MADDPAEVFLALMSNPAFQFRSGRILPVGIYGFKLVLKRYLKNAIGFAWITNIVGNAQWLVSNQHTKANGDEVFLLEPSRMAKPALGRLLYHVTPKSNVSGILASGIEPRTGGTTWLGRNYPPRTHHALTLWDAMCFVDTTKSGLPSIGGPGILTAADLDDYEVLEFAPPTTVDFWVDAWMTGACWTDVLITPQIVSVSPNWRQHYLQVAAWR